MPWQRTRRRPLKDLRSVSTGFQFMDRHVGLLMSTCVPRSFAPAFQLLLAAHTEERFGLHIRPQVIFFLKAET